MSDLVGLWSIDRVSALALPSGSMVSTTEVRDRGRFLVVSAIDDSGLTVLRMKDFKGDARRDRFAPELLRVSESREELLEAAPVVLLRRRPGRALSRDVYTSVPVR